MLKLSEEMNNCLTAMNTIDHGVKDVGPKMRNEAETFYKLVLLLWLLLCDIWGQLKTLLTLSGLLCSLYQISDRQHRQLHGYF